MITGREGSKISHLQGFHHLDDRPHPLILFFLFCLFLLSLFHFIFLALKRLTLNGVTLNKSEQGAGWGGGGDCVQV